MQCFEAKVDVVRISLYTECGRKNSPILNLLAFQIEELFLPHSVLVMFRVDTSVLLGCDSTSLNDWYTKFRVNLVEFI
jgi:hypothetical protein